MISYDIDVNKIRTKLAKTLEGYGVRIQYSVFECRLTRRRYEELYKKMFALIDDEVRGSIRIYPLCHSCEQSIRTIGQPMNQSEDLEEDMIII